MKNKIQNNLSVFFTSNTAFSIYAVFAGNTFSAIFSFIFTIIFARNLSLSEIGLYSSLISILMFLVDISDFGLSISIPLVLPSLKKELSQQNKNIRAAFHLQIVIAFILIGIFLVGIPKIRSIIFHNEVSQGVLILLGVGIVLNIFTGFIQIILSSLQQFVKVSLLAALLSFFRLVFFLIFISLSYLSLTQMMWVHILQLISVISIGSVFLNRKFSLFPIEKKIVRDIFRISLPAGVGRILAVMASRLDVIFIVSLAGSVEAGIYSLGGKIISFYPLILGSFTTVIGPRISSEEDFSRVKLLIIKIFLICLLFVAATILLVIISPYVLFLMYGQKGSMVIPMFRLLLISQIFYILSIPLTSYCIYYLKKTIITSIIGVIQLLAIVIGGIVFIPRYGAIAGAYSLIVAYLGTLIACIGYLTLGGSRLRAK
jgi:O-antigen/teichoic acid export membrane protein